VKADILWHYTNAEGFQGIVTSHRLRLADARFLNDRTERHYGVDLLVEVLDAVARDRPAPFLDEIRSELQDLPETNLFVCSFSEKNNSMGQWERYAERGFGYCLGFDKAQIIRSIKDLPIELKQISYVHSKQRALAESTLKEIMRDVRKPGKEQGSDDPPLAATVAATLLRALTLQFKNPAFREERDWRLIREIRRRGVYLETSHQIDFARRGDFIKPHLEILLTRREGEAPERLPLSSVVCGPKLEREVATESARYFLRQNGYGVPVEHSSLSAIWR
jgi:hypothetical protein